WSPDGRSIAYTSKPREGASHEVHIMEFATGKVRELTRGTPKEFSNSEPLWSPDGRQIAFTQSRADQKLDILYVASVRTGKRRAVTPEGEHNYHATDWSPDGSKLLITSNALNRVDNVALLDIESGEIEWIARGSWESSAGEYRQGRIAYETNVDGNSELFL